MAAESQILYVFLASPGDLDEERKLARESVAAVNRMLGRRVGWRVELLIWEETGPGYERPQARINRDVDTCDLFVGLLWQRWGQATGTHSSGFEEEFQRVRVRRDTTSKPEIWLIFKKIDLEKLRDPGDELKRVLAFRREQEQRKELKFNEFSSPQEWAHVFREWLTGYVLDLGGVHQPGLTAPSEASTPEDAGRHGDQATISPASTAGASKQLAELIDKVRTAVDASGGELTTALVDRLGEFEFTRLQLFASSLMAIVDNRIVLGSIELNRLFTRYRDVEATGHERELVWRTLIGDRHGIVPGWYWLKQMLPDEVHGRLVAAAAFDGSSDVRRRAIELLVLLRAGIETVGFSRRDVVSRLLHDDTEAVRVSAVTYMAELGVADDLSAVEIARSDSNSDVREGANRARFRILARSSPVEAFEFFRESNRGYESRDLEVRAGEIPTDVLAQALGAQGAHVRTFAARELKRRGELSNETAVTLTRDSAAPLRVMGFELLLERGIDVKPDQIREAFKGETPPSFLTISLFEEGANRDDLILRALSRLPREELRARVSFFTIDGPVAYRLLGMNHFSHVEREIRRDLNDDFETLKAESMSKVRQEFPTVDQVVIDKMLALDASMQRFIVQRFAAAGLEALAAHGSSRDADLARKYVTADSEEVKKEAVRVLERFGTKEDVDRLVPLFREGYGELREVAARTALTLDPAPHGVLVSMLDTDNPMLVSLALKSISPADFMEIRSAVESLLERRNPAVRVKGISFLVERLSGGELQELLNDYMKPPYYYNVVCWLDRILFAPEPLRDAFVRQLRDQGYLSSRAW